MCIRDRVGTHDSVSVAGQSTSESRRVPYRDHGLGLVPVPCAEAKKMCIRDSIKGLIAAQAEGFTPWIVFVIQMEGMTCFRPNDATHPQFGDRCV